MTIRWIKNSLILFYLYQAFLSWKIGLRDKFRNILFERIEWHIVFINKFFDDFFQWLETWSIICIICPTLCDYFGQFCRTNCWDSQMISFVANHIFNLVVVFFSVRNFPYKRLKNEWPKLVKNKLFELYQVSWSPKQQHQMTKHHFD